MTIPPSEGGGGSVASSPPSTATTAMITIPSVATTVALPATAVSLENNNNNQNKNNNNNNNAVIPSPSTTTTPTTTTTSSNINSSSDNINGAPPDPPALVASSASFMKATDSKDVQKTAAPPPSSSTRNNNNNVGTMVFTDSKETFIKACRKKRNIVRIVYAIVALFILNSHLNNVKIVTKVQPIHMKYNVIPASIKIENTLTTNRTPQNLTKNILDKIQAFMNRTIQQRPLPPNTPGAFLHVGKAGGSTLASVLQNACHSMVRKPCASRKQWEDGTLNETYVGALTTYIHVPDFRLVGQKPKYSNFDFYVVNLRDPFSRFLSVFTYLHPGNGFVGTVNKGRNILKIFFSCFPSLERFTELVGDRPMDFDNYLFFLVDEGTIKTNNCINLARAALANRVNMNNDHFYWSTKSILDRIPGWNNNNNSSSSNSFRHTHPPLVAIRTEYASQDFYSANSVLGDPHPLDLDAAGAINDRVQPLLLKVPKNVSSVGRMRLCNALLPEYKSYITALSRAINLSDQDRQNSLKLSQQMCPDLAWLSQKNFIS